jgi:hypothetical protein
MTAERPVLTHDEVLDLAPLYVIGALGRAEEIAVREHLETCPEAHPEFAQLGGVVPVLLEDVEPVEPPSGLKARILAAAAADLEARGRASAPATASAEPALAPARPAEPTPFPSAEERARRDADRPRRTGLARANDWAFRAAAVLALVALGVWNVLLQRDLSAEQGYRAAVTEVIEVAGLPGSSLAVIHGEGEQTPRGLAAVDDTGRVVFAMRDLPATQGTEVYTAWSIGGDGTPVPIGDLALSGEGTGSLTTAAAVAAPGATLALTREPRTGATAPTLPIVAAGVVTPAG